MRVVPDEGPGAHIDLLNSISMRPRRSTDDSLHPICLQVNSPLICSQSALAASALLRSSGTISQLFWGRSTMEFVASRKGVRRFETSSPSAVISHPRVELSFLIPETVPGEMLTNSGPAAS